GKSNEAAASIFPDCREIGKSGRSRAFHLVFPEMYTFERTARRESGLPSGSTHRSCGTSTCLLLLLLFRSGPARDRVECRTCRPLACPATQLPTSYLAEA